MLRYLLTFNPGTLRNKKSILIVMSKNCGGDPSTRWMANIMVCTQTIDTTSIMDDKKKIRERDKPSKRAGSRVQGIAKTQMEIVEAENNSLCTLI